jgi:protein associated with RNAse G/E
VFAVYAVGSGALRGWYCNITRPAVIEAERVSAVDLALDLWVTPDGSSVVLDEAEFAALGLAPAESEAARAALAELQSLARRREGPFAKA